MLGAYLTIDKIDPRWYKCFNDEVHTYFALRKVELIDGLVYLNNKRNQRNTLDKIEILVKIYNVSAIIIALQLNPQLEGG